MFQRFSDRLFERLDEFFLQGGKEKTGQGVAEMKADEKERGEKNGRKNPAKNQRDFFAD